MKKMDEMDRNIQLRAAEYGYKTAILSLAGWTLFNCWQTFANGMEYNPMPTILLCLSVCVQSFSQIAMKQKMIAGDDEYKEPNKLVRIVLMTIIIVAVVLSIGTYFLLKA